MKSGNCKKSSMMLMHNIGARRLIL